jgi:hypothetical protein
MKLRHAATLALVVWYLMRPPLPHLNAHSIRVDPAAPLARWKIAGTFPTQKECEAGRGVAAPWEQASPATTRASKNSAAPWRLRPRGTALVARLNDAGSNSQA